MPVSFDLTYSVLRIGSFKHSPIVSPPSLLVFPQVLFLVICFYLDFELYKHSKDYFLNIMKETQVDITPTFFVHEFIESL